MEEMISKELFSEVLFNSRIDIKEVVRTRDNSLNYSIFASINERDGTDFNSNIVGNYYVEKRIMYDDINIYELAHKCKEWALKQGYQFKVFIECDGSDCWQVGKCGYGWDDYICSNIFKACQWILDNKGK